MTDVLVSRVSDRLPDGIERLCDLSKAEGHQHVTRLIDEWDAGVQRFSGEQEILLAAHAGGALVGIGGMTVDPHLSHALRMRRFYVAPGCRGKGIARRLAEAALAAAPEDREIVVHAPATAMGFWEALGFQSFHAAHHNMRLPRRARHHPQ